MRDVLFSNLPVPFQKLRTYLWLVVFSRALGPAGYGAWSLFNVTLGLGTCIVTMNFGTAMMRFLSGERTPEESSRAMCTVLSAVGALALTAGLLLAVFAKPLASAVFGRTDYGRLVILAAAALGFDSLFEEMRGFLRARRLNRTWALFTLARLVPETAALLLVGIWLSSVTAIAWTYLATGMISFGSGLVYLRAVRGLRWLQPSRTVLRRYTWFGLALLPGGLASSLSFSADRYLVGYFLDLRQVGIYSVCFTISALGFFLLGPINDVLFPELSALHDSADWNAFRERFSGIQKTVFGFSVGAMALLAVFPGAVLKIAASSDYLSGSRTLAILGLQGVFMSFAMLYGVILNVRLRVWASTALWLGVGIIVVILDLLLVPRIGIAGAALSQLISSVAGAAVLIGSHWRFFRMTFSISWLAQAGMAFAAVCAIPFVWQNAPMTLVWCAFKLVAGSIVFLLVLVLTRFLRPSEARLFREALRA
ncbi:MAG TPA: oligosaccharide flippase family protein [Terriglobia bacterium]|nr:oligosaccharide flippase family protein [Terriglobia bacterium]